MDSRSDRVPKTLWCLPTSLCCRRRARSWESSYTPAQRRFPFGSLQICTTPRAAAEQFSSGRKTAPTETCAAAETMARLRLFGDSDRRNDRTTARQNDGTEEMQMTAETS